MYAYSLDRNDIQIKSEILPPPGIKVREMTDGNKALSE